MTARLRTNLTCVAIEGRGILIEGPPGSGKSTLALDLIDRGAILVGDDGVAIEPRGDTLWALPPPNIAAKLEIRGVGIVTMPTTAAPVALVIELGTGSERLPEPAKRDIDGVAVPALVLDAAGSSLALRAEWALRLHGLAVT